MRELAHTYHGLTFSILDIGRWRAVHGGRAETLSFAKMKYAELALAKARHVCEQGLEGGLQFTGWPRDDGKEFRRRALVHQSFVRLNSACVARLRKLLFRRGKLAGSLIELFLETSGSGTVTACSRRFLAALE